jgi:5-methylcytosine-specific restriction endonuclease McrBC regulatory subunit McrC
MENKNVGYILLGIAVLLVIIIFLFQSALNEIMASTCALGGEEHSVSCPMSEGINQQTYLSLGIVGLLMIVGIVLIFSKPAERVIVKKVKVREKRKKIDTSKLDKDERKVVNLLQEEHGGMFQATLKEKLDIGKVKLTRLLDKLEAKQLIERKRRGMNNIVVLKSQ